MWTSAPPPGGRPRATRLRNSGSVRSGLHVLAAVVFGVGAAGCRTPDKPPPQTIAVLVRDAETKAPVAGATVTLTPHAAPHAPAPNPLTGATGPDGLAKIVQAEGHGGTDVLLEVKAGGYLPEMKDVTAVPMGVIDPVGGQVPMTVDVFTGPRPEIALDVPVGYRGAVTVGLKVVDGSPPGQRAFRFAVPPDGVVSATGPAVIRRVAPLDVAARYTTGEVLRVKAEGTDIGFLWVKTGGDTLYFFVGTQSECDEYRRTLAIPEPSAPSSSGGKGGGRRGGGGGGRGGGRRGGGGGGAGPAGGQSDS